MKNMAKEPDSLGTRSWWPRDLRAIGSNYGVWIALVILIFQRRLMYFPTKIPAGVVESVAAEHGFTP